MKQEEQKKPERKEYFVAPSMLEGSICTCTQNFFDGDIKNGHFTTSVHIISFLAYRWDLMAILNVALEINLLLCVVL